MSALPPKADMCGALAHVCFGPIADIRLFDHLVGAGEYGRRHCEAECLRHFQVDHKPEFDRGLHRQITRLR